MDPIDPLTYPGWDDLILTHPDCSFFHTSAWARVLHESYGYRPLYFVSIKEGKIETLIPIMEVRSFITGTRGVSLPFTDFCPLIAPDNSSYSCAISDVKKYAKKTGWKYVEFRGGEDYFSDESMSAVFYTHDICLIGGEKEVFSRFRNSTRRNIKKAMKEDVEACISTGFESIKEFYRLNTITRKRHGLPPQPYRFFVKLYEHILLQNRGFLCLAKHKNKYVAGVLFLYFGKQGIYKYGASDMEYQHLRANNLVMWEAIRYCATKGISSINMGRTEPENRGLLQFKRGWGTTERKISYFRFSLPEMRPVRQKKGASNGYWVFQNMPLPLLRLSGTLLYKHVA